MACLLFFSKENSEVWGKTFHIYSFNSQIVQFPLTNVAVQIASWLKTLGSVFVLLFQNIHFHYNVSIQRESLFIIYWKDINSFLSYIWAVYTTALEIHFSISDISNISYWSLPITLRSEFDKSCLLEFDIFWIMPAEVMFQIQTPFRFDFHSPDINE